LKILVIAQYFPPDVTAPAYRIGETVERLLALGHDVHVVTAQPHRGAGDPARGARIPGDRVHRVDLKPLAGRGLRHYLEQYLGFACRAYAAAVRIRRKGFDYDVVWASSPPLFVAVCTLFLRMRVWRPIVFDVRDIWPDSAVGIGKLRRGSTLEKLGHVLEWLAYRSSSALTCVSEPMARYLRSRTRRKVTVVYNGVAADDFEHLDEVQPDRQMFCYAGNLGHAQGLAGMLEAFARARSGGELAGCELVLIGGGVIEQDLRAQVAANGLEDCVRFLGAMPKEDALRRMRRAGILVIPLLHASAFALTVPSKVFDCMAMERPILASLEGEGAEILSRSGANVVVAPGDVEAMADAMTRLNREWEGRMRLAPRNRELVRARYTREAAVAVLEEVLRDAAERKPR
jgi:glycosyltransferase involved in cell wall biosynthesis